MLCSDEDDPMYYISKGGKRAQIYKKKDETRKILRDFELQKVRPSTDQNVIPSIIIIQQGKKKDFVIRWILFQQTPELK